jgi:hypothetical protein
MESYPYVPLKNPASDLRLIEIRLRNETRYLECTLHTYTDDDCPAYEALSYAWGDESERFALALNGRPIPIASNLYSALWSLQKRRAGQATDRRLLIWIYALCIDQQNFEERNDQVQRMKSIYQGAKRVVVCLGDYSEPSDERIQFPNET